MSVWFSNRGQMIQVACAVIGAFIALMVWLAVPPQTLLYLAPAVFCLCVGWLVGLLIRTKVASISTASLPQAMAEPVGLLKHPPPVVIVVNLLCKVGTLWEGVINETIFKIVVHSIKKQKSTLEYEAEVEIVQGVGVLEPGVNARRIGSARYWIPRTSRASESEANSVRYTQIFPPYEVSFFTLRVAHVNPHANEVNLEICLAEGKPTVFSY